MIILGLNGWGPRSHDASAALLVDGYVVAFTEEERFTRRKHSYDATPVRAARYCLDEAGIQLHDVDIVAFGWDIPLLARRSGSALLPSGGDAFVLEQLLPSKHFPRRHAPRLEFVGHHLAHAASASLLSGAGDAHVLVLDGQGEQESTSLGHFRQSELRLSSSYPVGWSLGHFYEAACEFVGLRSHDSGKLMGLAAHGTCRDWLDDEVVATNDGYVMPAVPEVPKGAEDLDEQSAVHRTWMERFRKVAVPAADPYENRDFAATVQAALERAVLSTVRAQVAAAADRPLHVSGGVGFNATLNGMLHRTLGEGFVFVQPVAGDAGVALGAAAWCAHQAGDRLQPLDGSLAWGPSFTPDQIRMVLEQSGVNFCEPGDIAQDVAERVVTGGVVGWFQGRAEVGPRALGHRSLVALPQREEMRDRINRQLKQREWWRPLAPSVAEEYAEPVFSRPIIRPYMVVTDYVQETVRDQLRAVVHSDGSTRAQTVMSERDPLYHSMISRVGELSGSPVVLNTSYNAKDQPIVHTPQQALDTALAMGLDAVALGPFMVRDLWP